MRLQTFLKTQEFSIDEKEIALRAHIKASLLEDLYLFAKHALGYKDMTRHTHHRMCQTLMDESKRKLIVMPRGTFKSSIGVVAYSLWKLLHNPNERILIDSEIYKNSKNFIREIKAHIKNNFFIELFGNLESKTNWTEGEITIATRTKNYKEASITAGGVGTTKVGQHYSIIISDDLNSDNNSQTVEGRLKVISHYQMNTAILEPNGTYVIIGTRYAENDVLGHILQTNNIKI